MKKLVTSVLFVSVFFIGLSSIVREVGAKFKNDQKALALIAAARQAIGGEDNIRGVQSMTIVGTTTNFVEKDGVPSTQLGGTEINFEFPGRFSKSVKIGNSDGLSGSGTLKKQVDIQVIQKSGDGDSKMTAAPGENENVFVIKKDDGNIEWHTAEGSSTAKEEGGKFVIRKDDGSDQAVPTDGKTSIIVEKAESGDQNVWNAEDGKKVIIKPGTAHFTARYQSDELLRTTMALILTAPEGRDVSYKFLGEGDVDGYASNVIGVDSGSNSFKLYLDASSNLPRMISYERQNSFFIHRETTDKMSKDEIARLKMKMAKPVEVQLRFSDFRSVDGLLLPYRWTESTGGKQTQIFDVTSFEVNPANISEKFGNQKVFVRKVKPEGN